jgi:hypothetical protein
MAELFAHGPRTDRTARSFNEPMFTFIDRCGDPFFAEVRRLMTGWLGHVPAAHVTDLRRRLQSRDDAQFESAFWELYLHEAYLRSGYRLTIHPPLTGTRRRPDFLIEGDDARFYLEAVRACAPAGRTSENRRLEEARRVLADVGAEHHILDMATYAVGPRQLPAKALRRDLREWLSALDAQADRRSEPGRGALPCLSWRQDGWRLEFTAQPIRAEQAGADLPVVRAHLRMGWAHDASRILGALNEKANHYGSLEAPLVIAVLSNSEFHAEDLDVERALFGALIACRPSAEPPGPGQLLEPGHWCTGKGWRRAHVPQVIAVADLYPWTVTKAQPRLWTTLEPGTQPPTQPSWLARIDVTGAMPTPGPADSLADLFDLPADWPPEEPHFVARPRTATL